MPKIVLLVDKEGKSQTIVKGIVGSSCMQADKFLTSALGEVAQDIKTEEYDGLTMFTEDAQTTTGVAVKRNINFTD